MLLSPWLSAPRLVSDAAAQQSSVVRRESFLNPLEIQQIHEAAAIVAKAHGEEDLAKRQTCPPGGWKTVFLNHRLDIMLPELTSRLWDAVKTVDQQADWGLLNDESRHRISFRVAEYHTVLPKGGLPITNHCDWGSLITMDMMLSDTADFEGGHFRTRASDGGLTTHAFEAGDLLVFQSHKQHHVTEVSAGRRNVLVIEVWEGLPRRCPRRCTDPFGPCDCQYRKPPAAVYRRTSAPNFCRRKSPFERALEQADDLEHSDLSGVSASRVAEACSARRAAMEVAAHIAELEADEARAEWRLSDGRQ